MSAMPALTMYELGTIRERLKAIVAEQDGEILPDQEALWDAIDERFDVKVENTALLIRELEGTMATLKAEEERLAAWRKSLGSEAQRLEKLLLNRMTFFEKKDVRGIRAKVSLQKSSRPAVVPLVEIDEADLRNLFMICPQYVRREPESYTLDKNAIIDGGSRGELPEDITKRVELRYSVGVRIK